MNQLSGPTVDPWLAVYGDSLTRGVFFDVATLLNTSSSGAGDQLDGYAHTHPGHGANYSEDCTILETRPPLRRLKCGGFEYSAPLFTGGARDTYRTGRVVPWRLAGARAERQLRMSYRLKTFTWEEAFDEPWLDWLQRLPRLPDVLLMGFGVWDMQYPAGIPAGHAGPGDIAAGIEAFNRSLHKFTAALRRVWPTLAPGPAHGGGGGGGGGGSGGGGGGGGDGDGDGEQRGRPWRRAKPPRLPRVLWLTVSAISSSKLPAWKRPVMNADVARIYNERAAPIFQQLGIEIVDTYSSGLHHPELSADGVHFPGALSRQHAQAFLRTVCGWAPASDPSTNNQFVEVSRF